MKEWKVLARGENGISVSRCPEEHIHVELDRGELTLRFDEKRFLAFARTVSMAAATVAGQSWTSRFIIHRDDRLSRN